jgi:hypothetical protein
MLKMALNPIPLNIRPHLPLFGGLITGFVKINTTGVTTGAETA